MRLFLSGHLIHPVVGDLGGNGQVFGENVSQDIFVHQADADLAGSAFVMMAFRSVVLVLAFRSVG